MSKSIHVTGPRARKSVPAQPPRRGAAWAGCDDLPDIACGHVDVWGHLQESAGWWLVGWIPRPFHSDAELAMPVQVQVAGGRVDAEAVVAYYERPDLDQSRVGVILYFPGSRRLAQGLRQVALRIDGAIFGLRTSLSSTRWDDRAVYDHVRPILVFQCAASMAREHLRALTARLGFVGLDTVSDVSSVMALEIDEVIHCPPHAVVLKGWRLAVPGRVAGMRLRCGQRTATLDVSPSIAVARPDVIAAYGAVFCVNEPHCGFMAYVADIVSEEDALYLEVELDTGELVYKPLNVSRKQGLDAIRGVLEGTECRYADINHVFDGVLGPSVAGLNAARLASPFEVEEVAYGELPAKPSCTLVIPLYGRIDYLEYQIALFSADPVSRSLDLVYVLDDPPQRRELLSLAEAVHARFRLPFRLLLSSANRGFGPASNLGLGAARAPYVAFVNSDVFPVTPGWTDRLIARLKKNPGLGAIGPRLLYEDGSVQHEGGYYQTLAEYGGWTFVEHSNKGRRPQGGAGLLPAPMITAACLLMQTKLARELGGFDERYAIGDFEDADLCRRLHEKKLGVAVDAAVVCHHLERQSQARLEGHWRQNLTLFNAWVHQRRWIEGPTVKQGAAWRA